MITKRCLPAIVAFSLCAYSHLVAQQRVLLHINEDGKQEAIPLRKGERASDVFYDVENRSRIVTADSKGARDSLINFGKNGAANFIAYHQDVMFQWFDPPASGMVLEFGWKNGMELGTNPKSTIRAWQGDKRLTTLPTNALSPSGSGSLGNMGYYPKSDDGDGLKTPYKDEATDTNYVGGLGDSTIRFDPLGKEADWLMGGRQFSLVPGAWQSFKLLDFGDTMMFCEHQPFGFTKQNDTKISDVGGPTGDLNQLIGANTADQYPYHSIKFYEGTSTSNYGWQIRGYEWNMYVIVEYTTNRPPKLVVTKLKTTLKTTPRTVNATITGIYSGCVGGVGYLRSADLCYKLNSGGYLKSPMTGTEPDYTGTLPGANPGDTVTYYVSANFSNGLTAVSAATSYYIFKPMKNTLYMWNGRTLPGGTTSPSNMARYGMMRDTTSVEVYYDVWDVKTYDTEDIPELLSSYTGVVEATGDGGYADLTKFAGEWLASGTVTNPKSWFWSDQDHGFISDFRDTTFADDDPHSKYFGVKALINQDYLYWGTDITRPWELDFVAKTDPIFSFIAAKMDNDSMRLWYDPYHESPPFQNRMDELVPTLDATVLFKDMKYNTIVVGVRNSAADKSWNTVWLAFDYVSIYLCRDSSDFRGPATRIIKVISLGNLASRFISATTGISFPHNALAPAGFALQQNYPNPFNPLTMINYQLAMNSIVTLRVFDLLGREVATLVNEMKSAGAYTVQWDATRFASGVYFYRLQAGNFSETKKLLLLK